MSLQEPFASFVLLWVRFEPGRDDLSAVASAKEEARPYHTIW